MKSQLELFPPDLVEGANPSSLVRKQVAKRRKRGSIGALKSQLELWPALCTICGRYTYEDMCCRCNAPSRKLDEDDVYVGQ